MQQVGQDYTQGLLTRPGDYELPGLRRATHRIEDCTIAAQGTDSDAVDLRGYGMIGLIVPTITSANLTFEVSETEGGTYRALYNADGSVFTLTTLTGNRAISADDLAPLCAYRWVQIISSESQGAERIFHFIVKG